MLRYIAAAIITGFLVPAGLAAEASADFYLESEYRRDSIDYSETERYFFREKLSVFFSGESSLNIGYIRIPQENESRHTWSLVLNDISPDFSFLFGHYFVNFGCGLIIGRKSAYEPDIFSSRGKTERENIFKPCKSGNPLYAMSGAAASYTKSMRDIRMSLSIFYSIKERFINPDSYDSGLVSGGMGTIDSDDKMESGKTEPVDIRAQGGMISAEIFKCIYLQLYYLFTDMETPSGEKIAWDWFDGDGAGYGTLNLSGCGFFASYTDDYLNIFAEGAATKKQTQDEENKQGEITGRGLLYGITFAPPAFRLSLAVKNVDGGFYSPYSSSIGEDYPEDAFFLDSMIKPLRNLGIGSSISSQKKTGAGPRDEEVPATERQKIYIQYNYDILEELLIAVRTVERTDEDGREKRRQARGSASISLSKYLEAGIEAIYQDSSIAGPSNIYEAGIGLFLPYGIRASVNYARASVSQGNSLYAVISPISNSSTPGIFIREDSNIIISKFDFKYKMIFISCRYLYQFTPEKALHRQLEFFASGRF